MPLLPLESAEGAESGRRDGGKACIQKEVKCNKRKVATEDVRKGGKGASPRFARDVIRGAMEWAPQFLEQLNAVLCCIMCMTSKVQY